MRILVAGWHGQVAAALTERAAGRAGISAYAVGRAALDLCDSPSVGRTLFGMSPDVIVNTAAYTNVEGAEDEHQRAFRLNAIGSRNLSRQAHRLGVPIIHLSTCHVFDGEQSTPYSESDPVGPVNVYGRSKLESESVVAHENPRHVILRTSWIYSPFGRNFVRTMVERIGQTDHVDVVDDEFGSPTYAVHLADAIFDIAEMITSQPTAARWGIFHAAGAGRASWFDIAERTFAAARKTRAATPCVNAIKRTSYPVRAARPRNSCLDGSKLADIFDVRLPDWRDGVDDCVERILAGRN